MGILRPTADILIPWSDFAMQCYLNQNKNTLDYEDIIVARIEATNLLLFWFHVKTNIKNIHTNLI